MCHLCVREFCDFQYYWINNWLVWTSGSLQLLLAITVTTDCEFQGNRICCGGAADAHRGAVVPVVAGLQLQTVWSWYKSDVVLNPTITCSVPVHRTPTCLTCTHLPCIVMVTLNNTKLYFFFFKMFHIKNGTLAAHNSHLNYVYYSNIIQVWRSNSAQLQM